MNIVLVTGAAGSLGKCLVREYLHNGYTVRAYDINESALAQLKTDFPDIRAIYGSITDLGRLEQAMVGIDIVISAAAMKNIEITEDNPKETIETNINGTYNVAIAAANQKVKKAIFISSDKAVESVLLYGHSKLVGEKLWKWSNKHSKGTIFSTIRSGNFWESNGNVFEIWDRQTKQGKNITLTDLNMERYFIHTRDVAKFVLKVEQIMEGGEIFIPEMKLYRMGDLAAEHAERAGTQVEVTGIRAGEKLVEHLWTQEEHTRIEHMEGGWVIQ